jgi:hypothetical protein
MTCTTSSFTSHLTSSYHSTQLDNHDRVLPLCSVTAFLQTCKKHITAACCVTAPTLTATSRSFHFARYTRPNEPEPSSTPAGTHTAMHSALRICIIASTTRGCISGGTHASLSTQRRTYQAASHTWVSGTHNCMMQQSQGLRTAAALPHTPRKHQQLLTKLQVICNVPASDLQAQQQHILWV